MRTATRPAKPYRGLTHQPSLSASQMAQANTKPRIAIEARVIHGSVSRQTVNAGAVMMASQGFTAGAPGAPGRAVRVARS